MKTDTSSLLIKQISSEIGFMFWKFKYFLSRLIVKEHSILIENEDGTGMCGMIDPVKNKIVIKKMKGHTYYEVANK